MLLQKIKAILNGIKDPKATCEISRLGLLHIYTKEREIVLDINYDAIYAKGPTLGDSLIAELKQRMENGK